MVEQSEIYKKRWLIFIGVVLTTFINCVDSSSVNVALPSMADELGVSMAGIEWVVTANMLVIICLILIFGRLGDTSGKDRIFKTGILVFLAGSVVCFFAHSYVMLLVGRVIEGVGSAATMANSQGIIVQTFPLHERGKALGISGSCVALGSMVGPSVGGLIVSWFSWNTIFALNVPIALLCLYLTMKYLPDLSSHKKEHLDIHGALLFMAMIVSIYAGVKLLQNGAGYFWYFALILLVAALFAYFFLRAERKKKTPLLDLQMFQNRLFSVSVFCAFLSFFAIASHNFIQPFYLQKVLLLNAAQTGLLMMAYSITMCVVAPFSGQLSDKIGSEVLCFWGLSIVTAALLILSTLGESSSVMIFLIGSMMMAFGMAMFQSPNTSLIMSSVDRDKVGIAGSINGLARNLGLVFGISLSTLLLYHLMSEQLGETVTSYVEGRGDIFVYGMHWVYRFMAFISAVGAVLTGLRWKQRKGKSGDGLDRNENGR